MLCVSFFLCPWPFEDVHAAAAAAAAARRVEEGVDHSGSLSPQHRCATTKNVTMTSNSYNEPRKGSSSLVPPLSLKRFFHRWLIRLNLR
jgi:hypothetical protein